MGGKIIVSFRKETEILTGIVKATRQVHLTNHTWPIEVLHGPSWTILNNPEHILMIDCYFQVGVELPQNQSAMLGSKITAISNTHHRRLHVAVNSHKHQHATKHVTSSHCFMSNYKP